MERNFAVGLFEDRDPDEMAMVERDAIEGRREWTFAAVQERVESLAEHLSRAGLKEGDIVMTLIGNRPEWIFSMLAGFRQGYVVLACTEQLRAKDLAERLATVPVALILADRRNAAELLAAEPPCPVWWIDDAALWEHRGAAPAADVGGRTPALMTFTSGTSGSAKAVVHGHRYLWGQALQATSWLDLRPGELMWCTASSGWSKSARNVFIAPWIRGARAVLHDGRFDVRQRLAILDEEPVRVLCMAPTEYRALLRADGFRPPVGLRACVAAGEALDADLLDAWRKATGLEIRDGYGQTETGQITATPPGLPVRPGSMGKVLPGIEARIDAGGELVVDPRTVPTFFLGYHGSPEPEGAWHTGDRVRVDDDGYFYFEGRLDDVIISSGYRIGPFEVESALLQHPAVADAGVVAAADAVRGSIVRAVVVLEPGVDPSPETVELLQKHVKSVTAPYKYPRRIDFVDELPRTGTGKLRRVALREAEHDLTPGPGVLPPPRPDMPRPTIPERGERRCRRSSGARS